MIRTGGDERAGCRRRSLLSLPARPVHWPQPSRRFSDDSGTKRLRGALLLLLALSGCTDPVPATIYVPASDYRQVLTVSAELDSSGRVRAGGWLLLHARRSTGPWQAVPKSQADTTDCWWRQAPPTDEAEVASNVVWTVAPADSFQFNQPTPPAWKRRLKLGRPGHYRLWATSRGCRTPLVSDTIQVEVVP